MSRRDFIHVAVREALQNDGWEITDDPLMIDLEFEKSHFQIDIGAEHLLKAFKDSNKIAIEIKSFNEVSTINAFHTALGQFLNYRDALKIGNYPQELYLGVSEQGYDKLYLSPFIRMQLKRYNIKIVIVDVNKKNVLRWIRPENMKKR